MKLNVKFAPDRWTRRSMIADKVVPALLEHLKLTPLIDAKGKIVGFEEQKNKEGMGFPTPPDTEG